MAKNLGQPVAHEEPNPANSPVSELGAFPGELLEDCTLGDTLTVAFERP